jgi:hypothetical protein
MELPVYAIDMRLPMECQMTPRADIHNLFSKVFNSVYGLAYLLSRVRKRVWVLTGKEKNSGDQISVIFAGTVINKNYIRHLIFGDAFEEQYIEKRFFWNILQSQRLKRFNGSIIVMEMEKNLKEHLPKEDSFLIPCWLSGEMDLSKDLAKTVSTNIKRNIKKIVEKNFHYEIQDGMKDFDNFYRTMYFPYVNRRYSDEAVVWSYEEMKKEFVKCILLLVRRENDEIAGTLINMREEIPRLWVIGIKDGNFELVKEGAMHAIWYYFFKYFEEKGIRRVSLGYTRSFFDDGVLQYKKQWGMKIAGASREYFCVKPLDGSGGVISFLQNNPFIYEEGGRLKGAIFEAVEGFSEGRVTERHKRKYFMPGIDEISIFDSGNQAEKVKQWEREETSRF